MKNTLTEQEWKKMFDKFSEYILPFEKWKGIPDKSLKRELIRAWRKKFPDKEIRETWNMKHSKYYYYLRSVDLRGAGGDVNSENSQTIDSEKLSQAASGTARENFVIEAEYHVVSDKREIVPSNLDGAIGTIPIMSFQEEGAPERIIKRLKAIATNLELEEGTLELNIQIWRKVRK